VLCTAPTMGSVQLSRGARITIAFLRWLARTAFVSSFLLVIRCGDGDNGQYMDYLAACVPSLPPNWVPAWTPPRAPDGTACTDIEIRDAYEACKGPRSTRDTCRRFSIAPDKSRCPGCLFSSLGEAALGPVIALPNYAWTLNTAGCVALVDGAVDSGCAARVQAADSCYMAACAQCQVPYAYPDCYWRAAQTVCRSFYLDAVCMYRASYAVCIDWATDADAFGAMGKLFCSNVRPAADMERADRATEQVK